MEEVQTPNTANCMRNSNVSLGLLVDFDHALEMVRQGMAIDGMDTDNDNLSSRQEQNVSG